MCLHNSMVQARVFLEARGRQLTGSWALDSQAEQKYFPARQISEGDIFMPRAVQEGLCLPGPI